MSLNAQVGGDARQTVLAWVADAAGQGVGDVYLGKREAVRYVWPGAMEVLVDRGGGTKQRLYMTGQDVSRVGMGLFGRHKLAIGTKLWLRYADDGDACPWVPARVVRSTLSVGGYRIGAHFDLEQLGP